MAYLLLFLGGHTKKTIRRGIPNSYIDDLATEIAAMRFGPDASDWRTWLAMVPQYGVDKQGRTLAPKFEKVFERAAALADDTGEKTAAELLARGRKGKPKKK